MFKTHHIARSTVYLALSPWLLSSTLAQQLPTTVAPQSSSAPYVTFSSIDGGAVANPRAIADPSSKVLLPITGVTIMGNTVYSEGVLQAQMGLSFELPGTSLDDLSRAVDKISRYYRAQGYIAARAYIPQQTAQNGVMQVVVLEGVHAKPSINNTSKVNQNTVGGIVSQALCGGAAKDCSGTLIEDSSTERAFRLISDLPGVQATANFVPGAAVGQGVFELQVKPSSLPKGSISLDNFGSRYTGVNRLGVAYAWDNLNGNGDQLTVSGSASGKDIWSGAVGYSTLAHYSGTRVGLTASHGQYLLGDIFQNLKAHGDADSIGFYASHPLIRHRDRNLSLRFGFDYRVLKDSIESQNKQFDKGNSIYNLAISADNVDGVLGGGYNVLNVGLVSGNLRLKDADSQSGDALAQTAGTYNKLTYSVTRQQALFKGVTLFGAVYGQRASKNLDGSEKIGLGGPSGVRSYPIGEAAGDSGVITNLEIRYTQAIDTSSTLTYSVFGDYGTVQTNISPWTASTNLQKRSGYGVGLLWVKPYGFSLRAIYAGHSASNSSTVDPSSNRQFWLQLNKAF